jgi:hypothetical protein
MIVRLAALLQAQAPSTMPRLRISLLLAALLGALAALTIGVGSAAAASKSKTPCWRLVLNDEYDGHIDGTYPVHCYKQAIANLPQDSLIYGQLKQDITQAMLRSIAALQKKGVKVVATTPLPPEEESRGLQEHKKKKGFIAVIADKIGPGNASSIPLPLLILAGLGLLLIAAAGASFAARWIAGRRSQTSPATSPPGPQEPGRK